MNKLNPNNRDMYIILYADDYDNDIWEQYCDALKISSTETEVRINCNDSDVITGREMNKIYELDYGYHYIYSSCECDNEELSKLDGKSFNRVDDAIRFLLTHKGNNVCVMVWKERLDTYGNIIDSECVDEFNSETYINYL